MAPPAAAPRRETAGHAMPRVCRPRLRSVGSGLVAVPEPLDLRDLPALVEPPFEQEPLDTLPHAVVERCRENRPDAHHEEAITALDRPDHVARRRTEYRLCERRRIQSALDGDEHASIALLAGGNEAGVGRREEVDAATSDLLA